MYRTSRSSGSNGPRDEVLGIKKSTHQNKIQKHKEIMRTAKNRVASRYNVTLNKDGMYVVASDLLNRNSPFLFNRLVRKGRNYAECETNKS